MSNKATLGALSLLRTELHDARTRAGVLYWKVGRTVGEDGELELLDYKITALRVELANMEYEFLVRRERAE